jgi:23S rRNA (cytosine1962-C5)-methyltransferase
MRPGCAVWSFKEDILSQSFQLTLKPGREKSLLNRHPWVYSGAIAAVEGEPGSGETVTIVSARGDWLASAAYSPASSIRARVWSFDPHDGINEKFLSRRIDQAVALRSRLVPAQETNALRLIHGESDGLPGLIVDRYSTVLVMQILTAGMEFWRETIISLLSRLPDVTAIVERSDVEVRELEGLPERSGLVWGELPDAHIEILENGLKFGVDILAGQKTGFYVDQRFNRQRVARLCAGREVLNCFCYTGAFSVAALASGAAQVTSLDSSQEALDQAARNVSLNGLDAARHTLMNGDVFKELRTFRDRARSFDMIILDPPKFAPTAAQAEKAARGYKDINLLAFKLLRPGGILATFSCSGGISADLFQKIVAGAALDAGVDARIVAQLNQGADHPVALNFPEGAYLKGLICTI